MCWNTLSIVGSSNRMVTSVQRGIKLWSEARKRSLKSQSWVSHESVTSDSAGATIRHPLVMKGSIFFNETLQSPSGEWIEHVWTLFGVKQGIWNFGKSWAGPPTQIGNWTSNRKVTTSCFGTQDIQWRLWNTKTSVCWIRFILFREKCIDSISSWKFCYILHRYRFQPCCYLLIDYKTSYSFQHAALAFTAITNNAILDDCILLSQIDKLSCWFWGHDQSRFH